MKYMRFCVGLLALLVLAGTGCGSDEPERTPNGGYALERPDGCLVTLTFWRDVEEYELFEACELVGGGIGAEGEHGSYYVDDAEGAITFSPEKSSCEAHELSSYTADYKLYENGDLFIKDGAIVARLARVRDKNADDDGSGLVIELGCWDGDEFTLGDDE